MIDLHTHILPGIDDGVRTEEEAVEFARVAHADGIRTIVATPHCKEGFFVNDRDAVLAAVAPLEARLESEGIDVRLVPGAEVHICADLVDRIKDGRAPTLADNGRTLLLELSLSQYPVDLANLVFQLKLAGIVVVLAHPERIRYFQDDVSRYVEVVRMGAYGQLTTGSLLGTFGTSAREFSEELLEKRLVHVLATDAHNTRGRPPLMREAVEVAGEIVGERFAEAMATSIPRTLLDGREPDVPEPRADQPRKRGLLSRWFSRR